MAPKLLQKREVDRQKALDRKREIDEGQKLAVRVDKLREMESTEMKNLLDFRDKTMKQVLSKMRVANEELESVEGLIEARKEELVRLREPLDAEWLEIKEAKLLWEKGDEDLNRRSEHLRKVAIDLSVQEAEIEMTKTRISHESVQTLDNLQKTGELRQEAREILAKTRNEAQTMLIEAELRTKDAIHREMEVAARERDVRYALEIIERESERNANDRLAIIDGFEELIKAKKEIYG